MTSVTGNAAINQDWDFERARGRYWVNDPAFGAVADTDVTDNQPAIQAAIDAAYAAGGGDVMVPFTGTGIFGIDTGITIEPGVTLKMVRGAKLQNNNNTSGTSLYAVRVRPGGSINGAAIKTKGANTTFSGSLIKLDGGDTDFPFSSSKTYLKDIHLYGVQNSAGSGTAGFGIGISLWAYAADSKVQGVSFENIHIYQFEYGIRTLVANGTSGNTAFVNGNSFSNIWIDYCKYFIALAYTDVYNVTNGNTFVNIQCQARADSTTGVLIYGNRNDFHNLMIWDWANASGSYTVSFAPSSYKNMISGPDLKSEYINYAGTGNVVRNTSVIDKEQSLTVSASAITPNMYDGDIVTLSAALGENITVNNTSNTTRLQVGSKLIFLFEQDGTGSRTITWGANYLVHTNPTGGASEKAVYEFRWDGSDFVQSNTAAWA